MASPARIDRAARWSLVVALALAVIGKCLEWSHWTPFWGGLLAAFGEAALVGGLADWFAVRALFAHPFGIPFPHTALIPRNRQRIISEIRDLVLTEWLPRPMLVAKAQQFDFVGGALLPAAEPLRPHLRELVRNIGRELVKDLEPGPLAELMARGLAGAVDSDKVRPFLAEAVRRVREQGWLSPLVREWANRFTAWAETDACRLVIQARLEGAAENYAGENWMRRATVNLAQLFGGLDLDGATNTIVAELRRFAREQQSADSQLQRIVHDGLTTIEHRLREEPGFLEEVQRFLLDSADSRTLMGVMEQVLASLRREALAELEKPESPWLDMAMRQVDEWVRRLRDDVETQRQVNEWCRRTVVQQIEQHHATIGVLVEEQMKRLSEEALSELIQERVGEDLNWIRLNGTFVGGLVGVALYLLFTLGRALL